MKRDADHAYDINRLNMFFALASIIMFVFFIWMLWADYNRDWKHYQAEFRDLDRAKTKAAVNQEIDSLRGNPEYQKVLADLNAAEAEKTRQKKEYDAALKEQNAMQGVWYKADQEYRFKKAEYEAKRYDYEETAADHPAQAAKKKADMEKTFGQLQDLTARLDVVNGKKGDIDAKVASYSK